MRSNLLSVRAILARGWRPGAASHDELGNPVVFTSPRAVAWNVRGACAAAHYHGGLDARGYMAALFAVENELPPGVCLTSWESAQGRTVADVLALVDRALARCR